MLLQLSQRQAGTLGPPTEQPVRSAVKMQAAAGRHVLLLLGCVQVGAGNSPLGLLQHRSCLRAQPSLMETHVLARGLTAMNYLLEVLLQAAAIMACINLQRSQIVCRMSHSDC